MLGPLTHIGPEIVTQNIISTILQRDHNYTMVVTVESFGEISTSKTYFFSKFVVVLFCVFDAIHALFQETSLSNYQLIVCVNQQSMRVGNF